MPKGTKKPRAPRAASTGKKEKVNVRLAEMLAKLHKRFEKMSAKVEKWGLAGTSKALTTITGAIDEAVDQLRGLPADWAPPRRGGGSKQFNAEDYVKVREQYVEAYKEMIGDSDLIVKKCVGKVVLCELDNGTILGFPKAHVEAAGK